MSELKKDNYERNPLKRIGNLFFPSLAIAGFATLHDVYIRTSSPDMLHALGRAYKVGAPIAAVGLTLPAMTIVSQGIRGKHDGVNYFVGAVSCMPIAMRVLKLPNSLILPGILGIMMSSVIWGVCMAEVGIPEMTTEPMIIPNCVVIGY